MPTWVGEIRVAMFYGMQKGNTMELDCGVLRRNAKHDVSSIINCWLPWLQCEAYYG